MTEDNLLAMLMEKTNSTNFRSAYTYDNSIGRSSLNYFSSRTIISGEYIHPNNYKHIQ